MRDLDGRIAEMRSELRRAAERYQQLNARRAAEEGLVAELIAQLEEGGHDASERHQLEVEVDDRLLHLDVLRARCADALGAVTRAHRNLEEAIDERAAFAESLGDDVIFFPTHQDTSYMDALLGGAILEARAGYLFVRDQLLVWPEGFMYRDGVVRDDAGRVAAGIGEQVRLGGGNADPAGVERAIGEMIPAVCRGGHESVGIVASPER